MKKLNAKRAAIGFVLLILATPILFYTAIVCTAFVQDVSNYGPGEAFIGLWNILIGALSTLF